MACRVNSYQRLSATVSVVVPAYNTAKYIGDALASVFSQTYRDFEAIVINDGSADTEKLEEAIQPYRDRVIYLKQPNRGQSAARNLGIQTAQGEYIAFLDSDDCWLPEYLASQMHMFDKVPALDMVSTDTLLFGDSPDAGRTFWQLRPPRVPITFESLLTNESAIVLSCTVVRRQALIDVGLFDENFRGGEDTDLWLRLAYGGSRLDIQPRVLARRRIHGDAVTATPGKFLADAVRVFDKLERTLRLPPDLLGALQRRRARTETRLFLERGKQHLKAGEFDRARDCLQRAYAFWPTPKLWLAILGLRISPRLTQFGAGISGRRGGIGLLR